MSDPRQAMVDLAITHRIGLSRYSNLVVRRILAQLNRVERDVADRIAAADPDSLGTSRLEVLLEGVRDLIATGWQVINRRFEGDLTELAEDEALFAARLIRVGMAGDPFSPVPQPTLIWAAVQARPFQGRLLREWLSGAEEGTARRVREAIRMGVVEGRTTSQIVRSIRGTRALGYRDGAMEISRRGAEAMVRTAITHTAAVAHEEMFRQAGSVVKEVEWVSTLDSRTTLACFPGSVRPIPVGQLRAVIKRPYEGDLVVITTASGQEICATPNHPVLTARGWRAANELRPGCDILYRVVTKGRDILFAEDVNMPATFAQLADAARKVPGVDVLVQRAAQTDFHGDGQVADCEVYRESATGDLRDGFEAGHLEHVEDALLASVHASRNLTALCEAHLLSVGQGPADQASKVEAVPARHGVEGRFSDAGRAHDVRWSVAGPKEGDDAGLIGATPGLAAPERRHDPGALEQSGYRGRSHAEAGGDLPCRDAFAIEADGVVSVRRQFFSGHVYNLHTGSGVYIADGFVVHNCAALDGKRFPVDKGPRPPRHINCRSTTVPVVGKIEGVAEFNRQTYPEWLRNQPADVQDDILGVTRAKLFRSGDLQLDRFVDRKGVTLTLPELRERDASAFRRAGLP